MKIVDFSVSAVYDAQGEVRVRTSLTYTAFGQVIERSSYDLATPEQLKTLEGIFEDLRAARVVIGVEEEPSTVDDTVQFPREVKQLRDQFAAIHAAAESAAIANGDDPAAAFAAGVAAQDAAKASVTLADVIAAFPKK